jgi:acyl-coenzyme A synthetase/AMP-(fatty) acid ligase
LPGVRVGCDQDGCLEVASPFVTGAPAPFRGSDRIELLADGRFRHLGRVDGVVKIGAERVSVAEVERALASLEGVVEAAVLPVTVAGPRETELWAAVVAPGTSVAAVRAGLRGRLQAVAIPRRITLVERLPREETGKVARASIEALLREDGSGVVV